MYLLVGNLKYTFQRITKLKTRSIMKVIKTQRDIFGLRKYEVIFFSFATATLNHFLELNVNHLKLVDHPDL